ncbi:MAG: hypothetical protein JWP87_1076 [Labilithrix sp.]|nr:hypothetical protein [Labilithrix sp.]
MVRRVVAAFVLLFACEARPPASSVSAPAAQTSPADAEAELAERIRKVVVAERTRLRACYEQALAKAPSLAGRVTLVLEVGQNGMASHVFEAHREGLGEDEVKCFARVLKSVRFHDGAASAVKIQVPLSFAPDPGS